MRKNRDETRDNKDGPWQTSLNLLWGTQSYDAFCSVFYPTRYPGIRFSIIYNMIGVSSGNSKMGSA